MCEGMQLCLADELTNCTEELLANGECDEQCNNKYCSAYDYASTSFLNPMTKIGHNSSILYAADHTYCPYNVSFDDYLFCNESASQSIYLDPNVHPQEYALCPTSWIGDGICGMCSLLLLVQVDSLISLYHQMTPAE